MLRSLVSRPCTNPLSLSEGHLEHLLSFSVFSEQASYVSNSEGLHYAIVIDAGSSGSRAYLYAWPTHSGDPHELLKISPLTGHDGDPLVKKAEPGLSRYY